MILTLCPKNNCISQWISDSIWLHIHTLLEGCLSALTVGPEECSMSLNCINLYRLVGFSGIIFLIRFQPDLFMLVTSHLYRMCAASSDTPPGLKRWIITNTIKRRIKLLPSIHKIEINTAEVEIWKSLNNYYFLTFLIKKKKKSIVIIIKYNRSIVIIIKYRYIHCRH